MLLLYFAWTGDSNIYPKNVKSLLRNEEKKEEERRRNVHYSADEVSFSFFQSSKAWLRIFL